MPYAQIVLPIALDKKFTYRIPDNLGKGVIPGSVVMVPFRNRPSQTGYCVGLTDRTEVPPDKLKDIESIIEDIPPIDKRILQLTRWLADYYFCSWGEALEATLPAGVRKGQGKIRPKGFSEEYLTAPVKKTKPFSPTPAQTQAINRIKEAVTQGKPSVFLLHGVTGSGKTEVYLQVIDKVVKQNKQAIVLVPEISLTPQIVQRFRERFDRIAVLHSYLTAGQRANQWRKIRAGEVDIVIGARSAIFAPTKQLGIIVIDEEYETSFKQGNTPRYHARTVAIKRAEIENAVVILGSATPSLESYHLARTGLPAPALRQAGKFHYLELPERIEKRPLPAVEIIDMTHQKMNKGSTLVISKPLETTIREALQQKGQVILFLNRRGYITLITCPKCKHIIRCPHCQIALTYHKKIDRLICHHCNEETTAPTVCPECGYARLKRLGSGTERVEEYTKRLFSEFGKDHIFQVHRLDSDTMRLRQSAHRALDALWKGETDILVGTQMVAKGLDFPNVTLVGIISADTALYLKDFRSAERTFQMLTQVAGRTGRGEKGGRVIVQTLNANHYSIIHAAQHNYHSFAEEELKFRKALFYPPYSHLLRILVEGKDESKVEHYCQKLAEKIKDFPVRTCPTGESFRRAGVRPGGKEIEVLGPAVCPWSRIRNNYRWHLVIKAKSPEVLQALYHAYQKELSSGSKIIKVTLDVDPLNLL